MPLTEEQSLTWEGAYDATQAYVQYDVVSKGSAAYVAKGSVPAGKAPPNATYWDLLVSAPASGLITVAEYKASHIVNMSGSQGTYTDDEIQAFINAASTHLASQCYQPLVRINDVEPLLTTSSRCHTGPEGWLWIFPRFFPVQAVNSIKWRVSPTQDWLTAQAFDATQFTVQQLAQSACGWGATILVPEANPFDRYSFGEILLDYDAGYDAPGSVPEDLKQACIYLTMAFASAGWNAVDPERGNIKEFVPPHAWALIQETVAAYSRRF